MTIYEFFGITAGVLELAAASIYVVSILSGKTKPNRVTWWILALVSGMITVSYFASGARETIWLPAAYTLAFTIFGVLSLFYGEGPATLSSLDRFSLIAALLSAVVWWLVRSPVPALFMNICTEFIGLIPTINKSYRRPWTESRASWIIATVASLLNVFAITQWTYTIAAYPLYIFSTNLVIVAFLLTRKKRA